MTRLLVGAEIGGWRVLELVEPGGNAEIAHVVNPEGADAVLKAPFDQRRGHIALERFEREVRMQRELGSVEGVLPLLDSNLPSQSRRDDFAWLVTPLATRLDHRLKDRPISEIVASVADLARTLAFVHERGLAHRDIKPANLFWRKERAWVGDLGLIAVPDAATIARDDRIPGAFGFIADEVLDAADDLSALTIADWQKADVFALAKSLWAIAAGRPFAPQGHIASQDETRSLRRRLTGVANLDLVIDRATSPAESRLAMTQFADELMRWESTPAPRDLQQDIGEALASLKTSLQGDLKSRDAARLRADAFNEAMMLVEEQARDLAAAIREADSEALIGEGAVGGLYRLTEFPEHLGGPVIENTGHWGVRLERAGNGLTRMVLVDFCVQMTDGGSVLLDGMAMCGFEEVTGGTHHHLGRREAPMRSIELQQEIINLVDEARSHFPELIRELAAQA